MKRKLIQ